MRGEEHRSVWAVVAADLRGGIGRNGDLPWRLPADLKFFRDLTIGTEKNAVIMGRKTWASIPPKFRPLPRRRNIVLSRNPDFNVHADALVAKSFEDALGRSVDCEQTFVIGGASLYRSAFESPLCDRVFVTRVHAELDCDTFLPPLTNFRCVEEGPMHQHGELRFQFTQWARR